MIRRLALGALAAPLLLRPGLLRAQTQLDTRPRGPSPGTGAQARAADTQRRQMLGAMALALASAELATRQGEHPAVRLFAELEAAEQRGVIEARQLAGLDLPSAEAMPDSARRQIEELRDMQGASFDRAFVRGQLQGHQELMQLHQTLASVPAGREEAMLTAVAVPAIRSHQAMLNGLRTTLGG